MAGALAQASGGEPVYVTSNSESRLCGYTTSIDYGCFSEKFYAFAYLPRKLLVEAAAGSASSAPPPLDLQVEVRGARYAARLI